MAKGQITKFQGSSLSFGTSTTGTQAITGASKANPCVLTATAHGFLVGDVIKPTGIVGMTELNDNNYVVSAVTVNNITLYGVNSTDYGTYVSGGTAPKYVFANLCELTAYKEDGGEAEEIDVTTICSDVQESDAGLSGSPSINLDYNYAPQASPQIALKAAKEAGTPLPVKLVLPKSAGATVLDCNVLSIGKSGEVKGIWTSSATLKVRGKEFNFIPV